MLGEWIVCIFELMKVWFSKKKIVNCTHPIIFSMVILDSKNDLGSSIWHQKGMEWCGKPCWSVVKTSRLINYHYSRFCIYTATSHSVYMLPLVTPHVNKRKIDVCTQTLKHMHAHWGCFCFSSNLMFGGKEMKKE